jgi:pimeloyl-ACP methyl ester carboxylesterase
MAQSEADLIKIKIGNVELIGNLKIPDQAKGIVLFAHGSGSSRKSPRNQYVAKFLEDRGLATLLIDLLTIDEERSEMDTGELRFNIPLLAQRLMGIIDWIGHHASTKKLTIGLFGSSTGAAAALVAAAKKRDGIKAVVSRGGRPDLAGMDLERVQAPTLLIVGGNDQPVIQMNQDAQKLLGCENQLVIVPGATHLFEEHGALEQVAEFAAKWFEQHL